MCAFALLLALFGSAASSGAASDAASCTPVDMEAVPGAVYGSLSQPSKPNSLVPFVNNPNAACRGSQYKGKPCQFVDTAAECRAGCVATAGCSAWSVFYTCNTGPKPPGKDNAPPNISCALAPQNIPHVSPPPPRAGVCGRSGWQR